MNYNNDNRLGRNTRLDDKAVIAARLLLFLIALAVPSGPLNAAYEIRDFNNTGSIRGKVYIGNAVPEVQRMSIFKDQEVCGRGSRDISLVQANVDGLLNTVVFLEDISAGKPFAAAAKKITINQLGCRFIPYLSVMANGGEIEVINSDYVFHNIHTYEMIGTINFSQFSISQPQRGNIVTKKIKLHEGGGLKILCDAHSFMLGFVFVARNPYYAIVDADGEFQIEGVPPGNYTIKTWHGTLGEKTGSVSVGPDGVSSFNFFY